MLYGRGRFCPVVVCDQCGERIRDARNGNVEWRDVDPAKLHYAHKSCSYAFERSRGGQWLALELDHVHVLLGRNLRVDYVEAERSIARLKEAFG